MDIPLLSYGSVLPQVFVILAVAYGTWKYIKAKTSPLNSIPAVGYSGMLTSYLTAFEFLQHGGDLVKEGFDKYPDQAFRVANFSQWLVVLSGTQFVDDVRKAPTDVLSASVALWEKMQFKYTLGLGLEHKYHVATIRTPLTRSMVDRFSDIRDETVESFKECIPLTKDWTPVHAYGTLVHIICRVSNRFFVGLPLCRRSGYLDVIQKFILEVAKAGIIINSFPSFLRPLVGRYMTQVHKTVQRTIEYLGPTLEDRLKKDRELGFDRPNRPNDLMSWLLETATHEHHFTVRDLALRILTINFTAIHTTSMTLTNALYDLAIHPEYVKPMRDEIEAIISEDGWTKFAMQRMRKVDSFLKESQRMNTLEHVGMFRKVLKDYTLSDGTVLPAGTDICFASRYINRDERSFPDGQTFRGFRFTEMNDGDVKYQMVSLSMDFIAFGHGRSACPGRFFAVNEIKAIVAHILLEYDIQLENGSMERPASLKHKTANKPNTRAKIMFRKRVVD